MTRIARILPGLAALAAAGALAAPAFADDPGPGGERPPKPVGGQQIYQFYCQACHMADAKGAAGAAVFPSLASNPRLAAPGYPIAIIQRGKGGMPWFNDLLTPAQVAELVTWLRTHNGNAYTDPVTAADVEKFARK